MERSNRDGQWAELNRRLRERWGTLGDDEVEDIVRERDRIVGRITPRMRASDDDGDDVLDHAPEEMGTTYRNGRRNPSERSDRPRERLN